MQTQYTAQALPITTAFEFPGWRIDRSLGTVFGLVVRSVGFVKGVTGGFRSLRQGEVPEYTEVLEDARRHAMDRMIENARILGANAVLAMRFDSCDIGNGLAEVVAYGTAVVVSAGAPAGAPA
ncbi:MAG TPA: YbjQ family protein [Actinomycetota bacterium]|nr:YbjQ family protein [Actinomycetota bacterium]